MMGNPVVEFCEAMANAFADGDLDWITENYVYPLAIYLPTGLRTERTPAETKSSIFTRRSAALALGMSAVKVVVHEIGDMDGDRFPVLLEWHFLNADGEEVGRSQIRYFCRTAPDGRIRIEMLEFLKLAFPKADRAWPGSPTTH